MDELDAARVIVENHELRLPHDTLAISARLDEHERQIAELRAELAAHRDEPIEIEEYDDEPSPTTPETETGDGGDPAGGSE